VNLFSEHRCHENLAIGYKYTPCSSAEQAYFVTVYYVIRNDTDPMIDSTIDNTMQRCVIG